MPYAAKDRQEFIKRSDIKDGSCVFDLGGLLAEELPCAVSGITTKRHIQNALLLKPWKLPFKDSVFSGVVSYHYFDLISFDKLSTVFSEIARVLKKEGIFSFMILLWAAQNEAQRSSLFFNELLRNAGALHSHDFEDIAKQLSNSGFSEITVETIKREILVPKDYIRAHLLMLGDLVKKDNIGGGSGIKTFAKQYFHHVNVHGEAMLPALHFTARKSL